MNSMKLSFVMLALLGSLAWNACKEKSAEKTVQVANPASVHCLQEKQNRLEMRKESRGTYGVCIFPDGTECEEWSYFRGECKPGEKKKAQ